MPTSKADTVKDTIGNIVVAIHLSEHAYANDLYVKLTYGLSGLVSQLDPQWLSAVLDEMLKAQQQQNYVWLADLLQYILLPEVERIRGASAEH